MTSLLTLLLLQSGPVEALSAVRGRCISAQTGEALKGVRVELFAEEHGRRVSRSAASATDGTFSLDALPAGTYTLTASKAGYRPAPGLPETVSLKAGQIRGSVEIRFNRPGVITGRVTNPDGEPVADARIAAYRAVWSEGKRSFAVSSTSADDRGLYRLFGLDLENTW